MSFGETHYLGQHFQGQSLLSCLSREGERNAGAVLWLLSLESPAGRSPAGGGVGGVGGWGGDHHGDEIYQMPAQNEADA